MIEIKLTFDHVYAGNKPGAKTIFDGYLDLKDEIVEWLAEKNFDYEYHRYNPYTFESNFRIVFGDAAEAAEFKLRWC